MAETIKTGTIVINLKSGTVDLKAPDIGPILKAREKEAELTKQIEKETQNVIKAENARYQASERMERQIFSAESRQIAAMREIGTGAFQLTRAFVLLGVDGDESLAKLILGLTRVQAAFDVFKGMTAIVDGFRKAIDAAALANIQLAVAEGRAATAAEAAALGYGATAGALGAVLAGLAKTAAAVAIVISVVMLATTAWDLFTESEEEAAEKAKLIADTIEKVTQAMGKWAQAERELAALRRLTMTDAEKVIDLSASGRGTRTLMNDVRGIMQAGGPEQEALLGLKKSDALGRIADINEEIALQRKITDEKIKQINAQEDLIKKAESALELAKKQAVIEREKLTSAQAIFGAASRFEQEQLKRIRDRLRAGQNITQFEEEQVIKFGGDEGANIIRLRRAKSGLAAGRTDDFFAGIEGASTGLKDSATAIERAAELLKKAADGLTGAEAFAKLEADKVALEKQYKEFYSGAAAALKQLTDVISVIIAQIKELQDAALRHPSS